MALRDLLIRHEGLRLKPYRDTKGKLTIGVGRNLDGVGISEFEAMMLLSNDIDRVVRQAGRELAWFKSINVPRQDVVLSMLFIFGLEGFLEFKQMIEAVVNGNFERAADEMLNSEWAKQAPNRVKELASMMRTGKEI